MLRAERERRHGLPGIQPLVCAGDDTRVDEIASTRPRAAPCGHRDRGGPATRPSRHSGSTRCPTWIVAPFGMRSTTSLAMRVSTSVGSRPVDLDERSVDLRPPCDLTDVKLVSTERARHLRIDLEEERHRSDERRDVVAVRAQREVPVTIHRRGCGEHHRTLRRLPQEPRHLAEVIRNELAATLVERRTGHRREKVRHVQQMVAERRRGGRGGRAARASGVCGRRGTDRRSPRLRRGRTPARRWPGARSGRRRPRYRRARLPLVPVSVVHPWSRSIPCDQGRRAFQRARSQLDSTPSAERRGAAMRASDRLRSHDRERFTLAWECEEPALHDLDRERGTPRRCPMRIG